MNKQTPILIVGAGPTGLTLACLLKSYDIPFRMIEKKPEATQTSNALGIQARTLELLEDLGLAEAFVEKGKQINGAHIHLQNQRLIKVDLTNINSAYAYALILPQSETEKILCQHLENNGVTIERDTEFIDFIDNGVEGYTATVSHHEKTEKINTKYVIACDGAHSAVRKQTGINFVGSEIPEEFVLADVSLTTHLPLDKIHTFYSKPGLLALFPLPSGDVRLIANLDANRKLTLDEIDIKKLGLKRSNEQIQIKNILWSSTFWIHSKKVEKMRCGNIFLAGDAAHIHSPVGGQGMNTGMQDAYNLAWKLAYVIQEKAKPTLLDSYSQEREPVITELVKNTDKLTRMMLSKNPFICFFREHILGFILQNRKTNNELASRISMLSIHYANSPIINYKSVISNRSALPGDLTPEVKLLQPHHFTHYLQGISHWLIVFAGKNPSDADLKRIKKTIEATIKNNNGILKTYVISKNPLDIPFSQISDDDFSIHNAFNVKYPALCLIRPDKYMSYMSYYLNGKGLKKQIERSIERSTHQH